jgi:hypothetical protein
MMVWLLAVPVDQSDAAIMDTTILVNNFINGCEPCARRRGFCLEAKRGQAAGADPENSTTRVTGAKPGLTGSRQL